MARTPLFSFLRSALTPPLREFTTPERAATTLPSCVLPRRRVLAAGAAGAAALPMAACAGPSSRLRPVGSPEVSVPDGAQGTRVAVVGAGMAGLHCAYRLMQAGLDVTLFEASDRAGGRMFSIRDHFDGGQVAELGGELINSEHVTMHALAAEFDELLDDRTLFEAGVEHPETFWFGGQRLSETALADAWSPVAQRMMRDLTVAEADAEAFASLDALSIDAWLDAGDDVDASLRAVIREAYQHEYGLDCDRQSVLNLMYLIDAASPHPFRVLGDSDERYHTHRGNDALTGHLATALEGRIRTGHVLQRVQTHDDGTVSLTLGQGGSTVEERFAHVVLAIPQTLLRDVQLDIAEMPEAKLRSIREVAYGTNAKLMTQYQRPVWRADHASSGVVYTDNGLGSGWETSVGQPGEQGLWTNFVGGSNGMALCEGDDASQVARRVPLLDEVFPGTADAANGRVARFCWPTSPWALGSYLCYGPGQWQFYGVEGQRVGAVHFCGEHTSLDHQGYMEGAASTGALVAAEIIESLGGNAQAMLERVVGAGVLLPQSVYRSRRLAQPRLMARRQWLQRQVLTWAAVTRRG